MSKLAFILCCITLPGFLWAQAELDKVRNMFTPIAESIEVGIWKGHFHDNHPVELFVAKKDNEIKGYYRLISSGEEFLLEGEETANGIHLTEYNADEELGMIYMPQYPSNNQGDKLQITWNNSLRTDAININLTASRFSDYTNNSFSPEVHKYCNYTNKIRTCITLELLDEERIVFYKSDEKQKITLLRNPTSKNLSFTVEEDEKQVEYQEINKTLRKLDSGQFSYYELQNAIKYKRINYASSALIMDIEYPELSSEAFNSFITDKISKKRKEIRKEIKVNEHNNENHQSENHYQFKWSGWTEIDYIGTSLISGRMISIISRGENTSMEVTPFNYDLIEGEDLIIKEQFKSDFSIESFLNKFIHAQLSTIKSDKNSNPKLKEEDFKHLTFADNDLLLSTDYDWNYGETILRIPHAEMKGLVKRNSILKTLMKN